MLLNRPDVPNALRNARTVLLNALEALGPHRQTVTLIGAQALYFHTHGRTDINTAEMTTDADLAVDPRSLTAPPPTIDEALRRGGFRPVSESKPGAWFQELTVPELASPVSVEVDLLVPDSLGGGGSRGARLGPHGKKAARKAEGLEAALVDRSPQLIQSHAADDPRSFTLHVAGPGALLVAKMFKIRDRLNDGGDRVRNKDAADVLRLLIATDTPQLANTLRMLRNDELSGSVTAEGLSLFGSYCGTRRSPAIGMAQEALRGEDDPEIIATRFAVLAEELLNVVR